MALFAALMDTLLIPVGPTVDPIIVGVTTVVALIFLVGAVIRKS